MKIGKLFIGASLAMVLGVSSVRADTATLQITDPNSAVAPFPGPYANVLINRTSSTTATITFTSLFTPSYYYLMGATNVADLNINATSFTVGTISSSNSFAGFTSGPVTSSGSGNVSGFGTFNLNLDSFDGYQHSSNSITVSVTDNSGTWATAAAVLQNNTDGYMAAAHIFVTANPPDVNNSAAATGFSAGGGATNIVTTPVPVPSALLSGMGLLALLAIRRISTSA